MAKSTCPWHKIEIELPFLGTEQGKATAPCGCAVEQGKHGSVTWTKTNSEERIDLDAVAVVGGQVVSRKNDTVNHPSHYTDGPPCPSCGAPIECITITEKMSFNVGNAVKYLWRAGNKDPKKHAEDLRKAAWYATREAERIEAEAKQ